MKTPSATIWIIDGDHSIRRSLKRLLQSNGLQVETCASAAEFRRQGLPVPGSPPECGCVILDIGPPACEGQELQRTLIDSAQDVPVIFITTHDDPSWERQALEHGAIAVLRKPFDAETLLAAVAAGLGRWSSSP